MESVYDIVLGCAPRPTPLDSADFVSVHPSSPPDPSPHGHSPPPPHHRHARTEDLPPVQYISVRDFLSVHPSPPPDLSGKNKFLLQDRLFSLPDTFKLAVLLRITIKDAVRVSCLSRSWRHFVKHDLTWRSLRHAVDPGNLFPGPVIMSGDASELPVPRPSRMFSPAGSVFRPSDAYWFLPKKPFDPERIMLMLGMLAGLAARVNTPLPNPEDLQVQIDALPDSAFKLSDVTVAEACFAYLFYCTPGSLGCIIMRRIIFMVSGQKAFMSRSWSHEDRMSSLPRMVRSNIVARLPLRDAVCTTAISKSWSSVWASTPLRLDDSDLMGMRHDQRVRAITLVLLRHPGPFHSIKLSGTCFDQVKHALPLWLHTLADKRVRELILINHSMPFDFSLPANILTCRDLQRLWVGFFRFPTGHISPQFPRLQQFGLLHTSIETNGLEQMLRHSPVLEMLAFVFSLGKPGQIKICMHPCLRCLILWLSVVERVFVDAAMLERLVLWKTDSSIPGSPLKVQIAQAPKLRVLGYLEPAVHQLQIGDTIIQAGTKSSPKTIIPSVQILGLRVCFKDRNQSKLVPAFLKCFPSTSTLHIVSTQTEEPIGKVNMKFWLESQIHCVENDLKKIFIHGFQGHRTELMFLKFIAQKAPKLEQMVITPTSHCLDNKANLSERLHELAYTHWVSSTPQLLVNQYGENFCFPRATDLTVADPFFSMENLQIPCDE